jgi:hypothetical protein
MACFADGSVRFVKDTVDLSVWWALGTRSGGETSVEATIEKHWPSRAGEQGDFTGPSRHGSTGEISAHDGQPQGSGGAVPVIQVCA